MIDLTKRFFTYGDTNAEYQKKYRDRTNRKTYRHGNQLIRRCLINPAPTERSQKLFLNLVGCSIEKFKHHLNLNTLEWDSFLRGDMELDHIVPYILLFTKQPSLLPHFHSWFNLRVIPTKSNRQKKATFDFKDFRTMLAMVNFAKVKIDDQHREKLAETMFDRVNATLARLELN